MGIRDSKPSAATSLHSSTISDYEAIKVSPEEAFAIVECLLPLFERTLLILVAVTAIRISEAPGLRWSDIL